MHARPMRTVTGARLGLMFLLLASAAVAAQAVDLTRHRVVDLTHAFGPSTLFWPTAPTGFIHERLHFPSYGEGAARLLVTERQVVALGADVASIDYGASTDFIVHRIAAAAGVLGLENLANLSALPPLGATIIALPMKIENGSGGPLRAIALVPR